MFGSALLQPARSVCVSSERFFFIFPCETVARFVTFYFLENAAQILWSPVYLTEISAENVARGYSPNTMFSALGEFEVPPLCLYVHTGELVGQLCA